MDPKENEVTDEVKPDVTDDTIKTETTESGTGDTVAASGESSAEPVKAADAETDQKPVVKKPPFWQKRIDDLTGTKYNLEAKLQQSEAEKAALLAKMATGEKPNEPQNSDIEKLIDQKAEQKSNAKLAAKSFNDACNRVWDEGSKQYSDWEDVNKNLGATGAFDFNQNSSFMQNVTELENAPKVLHHLGNNPDEATRILALPSNRQAIELARLEGKLKIPPKTEVSAASAPLKVVKGSAKPEFNPDDPDQPMDKWMEWRNKDLETKRARR